MLADVAIIGGTGIAERLAALNGEAISIETPYGPIAGAIVVVRDTRILTIQRHSGGHKVPPHMVNYRAMATGLTRSGVKACLATAAVGSLRLEWKPGTLVVGSDVLDFSARNLTLFDETVQHTDMTAVFDPKVRQSLIEAAVIRDIQIQDGGVYVGVNGPRYETPAEIRAFRLLGGDVVGMTAQSESVLMREAGVPYGLLAIVTNLAAGLGQEKLSHHDVVDEMKATGERAVELLIEAAVRLSAQ